MGPRSRDSQAFLAPAASDCQVARMWADALSRPSLCYSISEMSFVRALHYVCSLEGFCPPSRTVDRHQDASVSGSDRWCVRQVGKGNATLMQLVLKSTCPARPALILAPDRCVSTEDSENNSCQLVPVQS